jgi:glycosyltransferase involved in cell wall biosynthesis
MGVLDKCIFADPFFQTGIIGDTDCPKEALVEIYNCFDLFLSTSHGEGWGLTATEAAGCEVPIALGNHSSFSEIFDEKSAIFLEDSQSVLYMGKSVPDFDAKKSAEKIHKEFPNSKSRIKAAKEIVESFDWEEINKKWQILIE